MLDTYPSRAAVLGTLTSLAILLPGCSGGGTETIQVVPVPGPPLGKPYPGVLHCKAEKPDEWAQPPDSLSADNVAQALDVSPEQIRSGKMGGAACREAIRASQIGGRAHVKDIGSKCLVIGLGAPPEANREYHDVLAVCAAPREFGNQI